MKDHRYTIAAIVTGTALVLIFDPASVGITGLKQLLLGVVFGLAGIGTVTMYEMFMALIHKEKRG